MSAMVGPPPTHFADLSHIARTPARSRRPCTSGYRSLGSVPHPNGGSNGPLRAKTGERRVLGASLGTAPHPMLKFGGSAFRG